MTQRAADVNGVEAFLSGFSGKIFIRLLHQGYDPETREPKRLRPRQTYGDAAHCLAWLEATARNMNSGASDDLKFDVFYGAGDPGQGEHLNQTDVSTLRLIYQDCDDTSVALLEPELDGQTAHFVIESSPGKRQRIWHTDELPAFRHRAIHDHMAALHHHDPSTHGPHRLLRMPGFRNWKYPDGPTAAIVATRELPRLTEERVFKTFGFHYHGTVAGNINRAAHNIQRANDLPNQNVIRPEFGKPGRSPVRDLDNEREQREADAEDRAPEQLRTEDLLGVISLIEPDTHRNEWRKVLGALHYMAGERPWGLELAEAWSMMGTEKFNPKSFYAHWKGLSADVPNPATWTTLVRMTRQLRHSKETRALLNCEAFKSFREKHGELLDYETFDINYPVAMRIETPEGTVFRPDPGERRNYEYLLALEGMRVYRDAFQQADMIHNGTSAKIIDAEVLTELYSTAQATRFRASNNSIADQVSGIASDVRVDPVADFIHRLPLWDGVARLGTAFQRLMGAPDTPSVRETLPLVMMAIVRRSHRPGFKFDLMPIIEGLQERGKSSFFRVLMPNPDWFGEGPQMNEERKRLLQQLTGKLVIEFGDLAGMARADINGIKKLITQQVDEYIPNHARKAVRSPRRCVFIGTINDQQYLRDLTGNRRFPIIPVTKELNHAELVAEREQLWAEAVFEEQFFGDELRLSKEAEADMKLMQTDRLDVNTETTSFMNEVRRFKTGLLTQETIWARLGYPSNERPKRVGQAQYLFKEIQTLMVAEGWVWNGVVWHEGHSIRAIYRKQGRGKVPEIVCNGVTLAYADTSTDDDDIGDLLK